MSTVFTKYLEFSNNVSDNDYYNETKEYDADDLEFESIIEMIEFFENTVDGIIVDDLYHPTNEDVVLFEKGTTIKEIKQSRFFKRHSSGTGIFNKYIEKLK